MRRRRQVGIAHAEIDNVGAAVAGRRLSAVDLLEHIGRQSADTIKLFHGNPGASSQGNTTLETHSDHLVSVPAVSVLPAGAPWAVLAARAFFFAAGGFAPTVAGSAAAFCPGLCASAVK